MRKYLTMAVAVLGLCSAAGSAQAQRVQIAFDDFEGLDMKAFDVANDVGVGDGTDYLREIPGWVRDDSGMPYQVDSLPTDHSGELAFEGGAAMDVDSWIAEQGDQGHRLTGDGTLHVENYRNTALIFDPDAWDDFNGAASSGYNSYLTASIDVSDVAEATVDLMFDYQFRSEVNQRGTVEVSFDDGTTWTILLDLDSSEMDNGTIVAGPGTYNAIPKQSNTMLLRVGCTLAGNNWSFGVDNFVLFEGGTTTVVWMEDFEGLELLPFGTAAGQANEATTPPGDGTDYADVIPNWEIVNDGVFFDDNNNGVEDEGELKRMKTVRAEGAFQGWRALDVQSWVNEQGGDGRSFFNLPPFPVNNTLLVADSDAFDDYTVLSGDASGKQFNSFIQRTYDVTNFKNTTIRISFDWETRIESSQRALVQASFDGGLNWVTLLDVDSDDPDKIAALSAYQFASDSDFYSTAIIGAPAEFDFGSAGSALPAQNSNQMILRIGKIDANNNWWFAVDDIKVEAEAQSFLLGDANNDGTVSFNDINAFVQALTDLPGYLAAYPTVNPAVVLDFNADDNINFSDINGMVFLLSNL